MPDNRVPAYTVTGLAMLIWFITAAQVVAQDEQGFLFIGDLPYSTEQSGRLNDVIAPAIESGGFPFLVHFGDFKGGAIPCSESVIRGAHAQITGLMNEKDDPTRQRPTFYTPGDNDWTDCDRRFKSGNASDSKPELKSLDLLRKVFYIEKPISVPDIWHYERQSLYPENALWRFGKVQFATVHLVGTNNGRLEILLDDIGMALSQVDARDQANRNWLDQVFSKASAPGDPADSVIIATQADVTESNGSAPCTPDNRMNCDSFAGFRSQLIGHAVSFRKPVLLVHGDTNPYCLDRKFGGSEAPNLWRLNAGGDYHQPLDGTVVIFRPEDSENPFSAKGLVEGESPAAGC